MPRRDVSIAVVGSGGDGVVTLGDLVAQAAAKEGLHVIKTEAYGPQIRGGESSCAVRVAAHEIAAPADAVDVLVVFRWADFARFRGEIQVAARRAGRLRGRGGATRRPRPWACEADENIHWRSGSVRRGLARGDRDARARRTSSLSECSASCWVCPPRRSAARHGRAGSRARKPRARRVERPRVRRGPRARRRGGDPSPSGGSSYAPSRPRLLMSGNEAVAIGALHAGCRFFAGYPITPSSEILHFLAEWLPRVGGSVLQTEDELAAIGAVIGGVLRRREVDDGDVRPRPLAHDRDARPRVDGRGSGRDRQRAARRPLDRATRPRASSPISSSASTGPTATRRASSSRAPTSRTPSTRPSRPSTSPRSSRCRCSSSPTRPSGSARRPSRAGSLEHEVRDRLRADRGGARRLRALPRHGDGRVADERSRDEGRDVPDQRARARRGGPAQLACTSTHETMNAKRYRKMWPIRDRYHCLPPLRPGERGRRHPLLGLLEGARAGGRRRGQRARRAGRGVRPADALSLSQAGLRGVRLAASDELLDRSSSPTRRSSTSTCGRSWTCRRTHARAQALRRQGADRRGSARRRSERARCRCRRSEAVAVMSTSTMRRAPPAF